MNLLPHWVLTDKFPALYDYESATVIEQTARVYAAMQELIKEYNEFVDSVNQNITDFENAAKKDYEVFTVAIRQEFQDFIDVINLKVKSQDKVISDAVNYMKTNLAASINTILTDLRNSNGFSEEVLKVFADLTNQMAAMDARINNFVTLPNGSTTGDAELSDIRVSYDGHTYDSAGAAVRAQASDIMNMIARKYSFAADNLSITSISDKTGEDAAGSVISLATDFIEWVPNDVLSILQNTDYNLGVAAFFYDSEKTFLNSGAITYANTEAQKLQWNHSGYIRFLFVAKNPNFLTDSDELFAVVTENASFLQCITAHEYFADIADLRLSKIYPEVVVTIDHEEMQAKLVTANGAIHDAEEWRGILLQVNPGEKYLFTGAGINSISTAPLAIFFEKDSNVIVGTHPTTNDLTYYDDYLIEIPAGAFQVWFNWYYPPDERFPLELKKVSSNYEEPESIWENHSLCINGDSIETYTAGIWPLFLKAAFPFKSVTNIAVGGTDMTGRINSDERIAQIPADAGIVLTGGLTNDWAHNIPLGSMETINDSSTVYGALHLYIQKVQAQAPNALIVLMSNNFGIVPERFPDSNGILNNLGLSPYEYFKGMREVAELNGIPYIPVFENCGINRFNVTNFTLSETDSGTGEAVNVHPNGAGAARMAKIIIKAFNDLAELL